MDKHLSKAECQAIGDHYLVPRTPTLEMTDYRTFLHDVDIIFTVPVGASSASAGPPRCFALTTSSKR